MLEMSGSILVMPQQAIGEHCARRIFSLKYLRLFPDNLTRAFISSLCLIAIVAALKLSHHIQP
jgi:hypothetical protein